MPVTLYQLSATGITATTEAVASVQVQKRGRIKQAYLSLNFNSASVDVHGYVELSIVPYSFYRSASGINLGNICFVEHRIALTTSGAVSMGNAQLFPLDHPVEQFQTLYLNVVEAVGTQTLSMQAMVWIQD